MAEAEHAYAGDDKYTVQLPYALALSAEHDVFRFDAIVVDEAQDFPDEFWLPLELLLTSRTEARLFVFFDTNQSVYRMSSSLPISEPPLLLTENCRNTRPIHEAAYQFYSGEEVDPPEIQGAPQQVLTGNGVEEQARLLGKLVIQLTHGDALNPQDIAVLIVGEPKELYYEALRCLPLPHGLKWGIEQGFAEKTIVVDTVKRFKGLEAPVVILWGVDAVDPLRHRELLYVALSRARSRLFVVSDGQRLAAILSKGHPDSREIQRYRT